MINKFFIKKQNQGWSTLKKLKNERPFKQPSLTTFTPFFQRKRQRHKWSLNLIVFKIGTFCSLLSLIQRLNQRTEIIKTSQSL